MTGQKDATARKDRDTVAYFCEFYARFVVKNLNENQMKTIILWTLVLLLAHCHTPLYGQKKKERIIQSGQKDFRIGIGLVPTYLMDKASIILPPVTFGSDFMVSDNLSIGGQFGYSVSAFDRQFVNLDKPKNYRNASYFFGVRGAAHCTRIANWDIYGGFNLGYDRIVLSAAGGEAFGEPEHSTGMKERRGKMSYTGFMGVKYVCCHKVGVFGEIGYGASLVSVGMTWRI